MPQPPTEREDQLTPATLSHIAKRAFPHGGLAMRTLQHYRPYICPFEAVLPHVPRNASILDVGCGGGLFIALCCATRSPTRVVGFDASKPAIGMAHANRATLPPRLPTFNSSTSASPGRLGLSTSSASSTSSTTSPPSTSAA